ncbi:MAG: zinc-ribbon and DUF3426 domain-containing protein [Gallionella sp.]|nr:zinc-ribbon and DUF3426 domain-containing protein [Gallionella sp.]
MSGSALDGSGRMSGTTLCPHCNTRFKVDEAQLKSHEGMVRCGSCLQAFDARPGFMPEQPSPQLELPILDEMVAPEPTADAPPAVEAVPAVKEENEAVEKTGSDEAVQPGNEEAAETGSPEILQDDIPHNDSLDFNQQAVAAAESAAPPKTLAEQVAIVQDENGDEPLPEYRRWPWVVASVLLVLVLFAQAVYFFRVDLAAHLPGLKPALVGYCKLLRCSLPLPQNTNLMSIESSDLEADSAHENRVVLNVLLRNRAAYAQAFPNLELTLNDTHDKPLARRTFVPKDYLTTAENEKTGLPPNQELSIKLQLGTTDLKPSGYRLALHYPRQ